VSQLGDEPLESVHLIKRAIESLDAAISCLTEDPEAALDDMLAARLLLLTSLSAPGCAQRDGEAT
jgi:hypothetical protein